MVYTDQWQCNLWVHYQIGLNIRFTVWIVLKVTEHELHDVDYNPLTFYAPTGAVDCDVIEKHQESEESSSHPSESETELFGSSLAADFFDKSETPDEVDEESESDDCVSETTAEEQPFTQKNFSNTLDTIETNKY